MSAFIVMVDVDSKGGDDDVFCVSVPVEAADKYAAMEAAEAECAARHGKENVLGAWDAKLVEAAPAPAAKSDAPDSGAKAPVVPADFDPVAALVAVYAAWCAANGYALGSADEHVNDAALSPEARDWLRAYIVVWDGVAA
jgi:hypothetical protein